MGEELRIKTEENTKTNWIAAIDSWDYCDPIPLGEMIKNHGIPDELRPVLSAIVTGERKQNNKAGSGKIKPSQRMIIADTYLHIRQIPNAILSKRTRPTYEEIADQKGDVDVIDLVNKYRAAQRKYDLKVRNMLRVSERTLKALVSEFKLKIKNYPNL